MRRLEVAALTGCAGGRDVVSAVTFEVAVGEIVVIVGPNGAGKTSRATVSLVRPARRSWCDRRNR